MRCFIVTQKSLTCTLSLIPARTWACFCKKMRELSVKVETLEMTKGKGPDKVPGCRDQRRNSEKTGAAESVRWDPDAGVCEVCGGAVRESVWQIKSHLWQLNRNKTAESLVFTKGYSGFGHGLRSLVIYSLHLLFFWIVRYFTPGYKLEICSKIHMLCAEHLWLHHAYTKE